MLARRGSVAEVDDTPRQVVSYIEDLVTELAGLAAKHGRTELAASLSILAIQAGAERRRMASEH